MNKWPRQQTCENANLCEDELHDKVSGATEAEHCCEPSHVGVIRHLSKNTYFTLNGSRNVCVVHELRRDNFHGVFSPSGTRNLALNSLGIFYGGKAASAKNMTPHKTTRTYRVRQTAITIIRPKMIFLLPVVVHVQQ